VNHKNEDKLVSRREFEHGCAAACNECFMNVESWRFVETVVQTCSRKTTYQTHHVGELPNRSKKMMAQKSYLFLPGM
jgi:hypothetical protein